jgi:galactokinase
MSDQQKLAETNYAERQVAIEKAKRKMDDALRDGDNLGAMEAVDNIINHATKIRKILVTNKLK